MRTGQLAISATAMMLVCGSALGQNALGDGRALDAGLHATQGKYNPRGTSVSDQIRFNNAVINGSAPGGFSFRGSVPYRATDQFGGRTGSDTLYNFQRDSWASGLASQGVRGSDALRYQLSLTTGQRVPGYLATQPGGLQRESTVSTSSNAAVTALRSTSEFVTGQASRPSLIGVRQDEWGAEYVAKASPLLGVAWVKTAESPLGAAAARPAPIPGATPPGSVAPGTPNPAAPLGTPPAPGAAPATPAFTPPSASGVRPGLSGMESTVRGTQGVLDRTTGVDTRVPGASSAARNELETRVIQKFREGFDEKPSTGEPKGAAETLTFEAQMDRLHRRLSGDSRAVEDNTKPTRNADGTSIAPPLPKDDKEGAKSSGDPRPGLKVDEPKDDKERADRKKKDRALGLPDPSTAITPEVLRGMRKARESKVEHLITPAPAVGADMPDPDGYQSMMRDGEDLLSKGQFFAAEERFVRAIAAAQGDVMARTGRIHAEIGAGLYLSASTNLRLLIADHPEVVSVRYADRLMPNADRAKVVAEQLQAEETKAESLLGRESALLLAYVGYQRGDTVMTAKGLDDLAKRIPEDETGDADRTLLALVRAAWSN
jgi:hypothetical protein